jgi:hypothetical protein
MFQSLPPSIDELRSDPRFHCVESIDHEDLASEMRRIFRWKSMFTAVYILLNIIVLALAGWFLASSPAPFDVAFGEIGLGFFVGYVMLMPLHEYVHAAAYRLFGATGVSVHYRLRTLTAYCLADRCVVEGWPFVGVCLAPLIVLNLLLALLYWEIPAVRGGLCGGLILHTAAATGDVALANLVWERRASRMWTYDDSAAKRTYFYVECDPPPWEKVPGVWQSRSVHIGHRAHRQPGHWICGHAAR